MKADWSRLASLQPLHHGQDAVLTKTHPNCIDSFDIAAKFFFFDLHIRSKYVC